MTRKQKILSILTAAALIGSSLAGCKSSDNTAKTNTGDGSSTATYPIKTNVKLTYWVQFNNQSTSGVKTFADLPYYQELKKKTGIDIEFIHPVEGQAKEQFNLMIASGEYPDIMEKEIIDFPGGPEKAIKDGIIIGLNDVLDKYSPNLKKFLNDHKGIDKMVKTDKGTYYTYPCLRYEKSLKVYQGPIIRKDWLDELGLKVPVTIDDWYVVLKEFKEKKKASSPLSFINDSYKSSATYTSAAFIGAFGIRQELYVEDGKVKYGEYQPEYKEFLATFRKWYAEGLLDKNISLVDTKTLEAKILDGSTGGTIGNTAGGSGKWSKLMEKKDPSFKLAAVPYPVLKKGETPKHGQYDTDYSPFGSACISAQCKNVEIAARLLDYGYSEEGKMLANFGTEGVSYKMENGYPKYTDLIAKNPDGKSMSEMLGKYGRPNGAGPHIVDPRSMEQYTTMPEQQESLKVWAQTEAEKTKMPRVTLQPEESNEVAQMKSELDTYINEKYLKFIMGVEPLENFDQYINQLKKLKIERYIELYQNALDRYNKR